MTEPDKHALARYRELLARTETDLKLAHDVALALGLPFKRVSRLIRAKRELKDELGEAERERNGGDGR